MVTLALMIEFSGIHLYTGMKRGTGVSVNSLGENSLEKVRCTADIHDLAQMPLLCLKSYITVNPSYREGKEKTGTHQSPRHNHIR